jgi:hypothetical protein
MWKNQWHPKPTLRSEVNDMVQSKKKNKIIKNIETKSGESSQWITFCEIKFQNGERCRRRRRRQQDSMERTKAYDEDVKKFFMKGLINKGGVQLIYVDKDDTTGEYDTILLYSKEIGGFINYKEMRGWSNKDQHELLSKSVPEEILKRDDIDIDIAVGLIKCAIEEKIDGIEDYIDNNGGSVSFRSDLGHWVGLNIPIIYKETHEDQLVKIKGDKIKLMKGIPSILCDFYEFIPPEMITDCYSEYLSDKKHNLFIAAYNHNGTRSISYVPTTMKIVPNIRR